MQSRRHFDDSGSLHLRTGREYRDGSVAEIYFASNSHHIIGLRASNRTIRSQITRTRECREMPAVPEMGGTGRRRFAVRQDRRGGSAVMAARKLHTSAHVHAIRCREKGSKPGVPTLST